MNIGRTELIFVGTLLIALLITLVVKYHTYRRETDPYRAIIDPKCRTGKHRKCLGYPCECPCHVKSDVEV